MRAMTLPILAIALSGATAAPLTAQTQAPSQPQTAPSTAPPQAIPFQPVTPKTQSPVVFPVDGKYAIIDTQAIASTSVIGKEASKKLNDLQSKKAADLQDKNKQLQALQAKRETGGPVLNDAARAQLDKEIEKLQRDIQYASSSAQADLQDLNNELMADFTKKVEAAVHEIAMERHLYIVFTADAGVAYAAPEVNLSDEVIKRLDAKKN